MNRRKCILWTLLLIVAVWGLARAPGSFAEESGPKTFSTGIGEDRRMPHPEYSVLFVFAKKDSGDLGADVQISIFHREGNREEKVLDAFSRGPWFFVDLKPGKYSVEAVFEGKKQGVDFEVEGKGQKKVELAWP